MKKTADKNCVSICGLFCGACPAYPQECHGCLSDYLRESCRECKSGFRHCAKIHNVSHCYACTDFPCERIEKFSQGPYIDGVNNHDNVIYDCIRIKSIGTARWLDEQVIKFTCPECGQRLTWYNINNHTCK